LLTRPDKQTIQALASLEGNTDFATLIKWVKESREHLVSNGMLSQDEVRCRWHQGAWQALDEFLGYAEKARDLMRRD
jgi:hypothetical protein